MLKLGLCCAFIKEDIHFRAATARYVLSLPTAERLKYIDQIAVDNADALLKSVAWCAKKDIGAFRINSAILPLYTHPTAGYRLEALPRANEIAEVLRTAGRLAKTHAVRLSFHPDQFVVPGSPSEATARMGLEELESSSLHAGWIINRGGDELVREELGESSGVDAFIEPD